MKIIDVKIHGILCSLSESFGTGGGKIPPIQMTAVEVMTDEGITGIGLAYVTPDHVDKLKPLVIGEDPLRPERVWQKLFNTVNPYHQKMETVSAIGALDIALYDILGKVAGVPLWKLLGGFKDKVSVYASGGYYREGGIKTLVEELTGYVKSGDYKAVKMKVGKASLEEDLNRIKAVRQALGDEIDLMIDANRAYDIETAIEAAYLFEPYRIRWFEEPVHWSGSAHDLGRVSQTIHIPVACGENENTVQGCRDLVTHGGVRILQFECTSGGGITPMLKAAALAGAYNVAFSSHREAFIHVQVLGAIPNGLTLECFPNLKRDPLSPILFTEPPVVRNGFMELTQKPGLGLDFNRETLAKYKL